MKAMRLNYPQSLEPGDRIAMVAPASPFDRDRFQRALEVIQRMGFEPVFTDRIFHKNGYLAGTEYHRIRDIEEFFASPDVKALWATRGGYGTMRLLSGLDYQAISDTPKIFIGCSDITALLNTFYSRCSMPVFHGPVAASLADADEKTLKGFLNAIAGSQPLQLQADPALVIREGRASGPVLGGNLATLCHLLATPYAPDFKGCILFIEDTGEKPYRIDRMLTQMQLAGCFDYIAGLAAGSFRNCGPEDMLHRIIADLFANSSFPVVTGFPAGHCRPNITLPLGVEATLDSFSAALIYHERAVRGSGDLQGAGGR